MTIISLESVVIFIIKQNKIAKEINNAVSSLPQSPVCSVSVSTSRDAGYVSLFKDICLDLCIFVSNHGKLHQRKNIDGLSFETWIYKNDRLCINSNDVSQNFC